MNTDSSYEVQASNEAVITAKPTNTLGVVALVLAIIGLLLTISLVGIFLGVPLLVVALILGLIAVCKPPRGKAVASLIIAVISLGVVTYASFWIVGILIPPVKSFIARTTEESQTNTEFRLVVKQP
jgi:NADH:ubiquinone oxidoreductase subunit K